MNRRTTKLPLEDDEAIAFADWLRAQGMPFAHIANESRSSSRAAAIRGQKLKRMGQAAGVWDYEIFIPVTAKGGEITAYQEVRIELKRKRGGKVSDAQQKWGGVYMMAGIPCAVCKGAEEAIRYIRVLQSVLEDGGEEAK